MQIDGGKNDGYAAWSDAGGLAMGHYDYSQLGAVCVWRRSSCSPINFFQGAFGGSFLNHQYLICACAPEYPNADTAAAKPAIAVLEQDAAGRYLPRLQTGQRRRRRRSTNRRRFANSGNITPANYFGDGKFYAVNTMQPPYQPSGNKPAAADADYPVRRPRQPHDPAAAEPSEPSATRWTPSRSNGRGMRAPGTRRSRMARRPPSMAREVIYAPATAGGNPDFQPHHQPFNYYESL